MTKSRRMGETAACMTGPEARAVAAAEIRHRDGLRAQTRLLEALEEDRIALREALVAAEERIARQAAELGRASTRREGLERQLGALRDELSRGELERGEMRARTEELERQLAASRDALAASDAELRAGTDRQDDLERRLGRLGKQRSRIARERDVHAARLRELLDSTSWRITLPLRRLVLAFRRLRRGG